MSKKSKFRKLIANRLRSGEVIRLRSKVGYLPAGLYRVDGVAGPLLMLSAGEIRVGVHRSGIDILARRLPEPATWLEQEVKILQQNAAVCGCQACAKLLLDKESELAAFRQAYRPENLQ